MSAAKVYDFEYDRADQLTAATLKTTDPTPTVLKRYVYGYDPAGNRTSEQIDNGVVSASHNNMNQTTSTQPGGMLRLAGTTNEAANVTVGGLPARILDGNRFQGETPVGSGTTSVPVVATDGSGNARTYTYNVSVSGSTKTLTYDPNGNLLSDGTRTYEWDALDQLTAINQGTHRSEFTYDSNGRRVKIVEKDNGVTTADRRFVWNGAVIYEERNAAGDSQKRYLSGGLQESGANYLLLGDHLGTTRELTSSSGQVSARYDYDPWGRRTKTSGSLDSDLGFTGHLEHSQSSLTLALYRPYDSTPGRWLSQDPIGLSGGINLYQYVENDPVNDLDPLGLACINWSQAAGAFLLGIGAAILAAVVIGGPLILAMAALPALGVPVGVMLAIKMGLFVGGLVGTAAAMGTAYYQLRAGCTNEAFFTMGNIIGGWLVGLTLWGAPAFGKPNIATQVQIPRPTVPAGTRPAHFAAANQQLQNAMSSNPLLSLRMALNGVRIPTNNTATPLGSSPPGWTWHHANQPGMMQLVLRSQHQFGGRFFSQLHPGGGGGMKIWGHLY